MSSENIFSPLWLGCRAQPRIVETSDVYERGQEKNGRERRKMSRSEVFLIAMDFPPF